MGAGKAAATVMRMDEESWRRHANPWSGWSRVAVLPLLALACWARIWIDWWWVAALVTAVVVFTWINPRLFGPPKSVDNWMSQGVLGEKLWLATPKELLPAHHRQAIAILNLANGLGFLTLIAGLALLDPALTYGGLVMSMGAKLWFLDRMVWLKADLERGGIGTDD